MLDPTRMTSRTPQSFTADFRNRDHQVSRTAQDPETRVGRPDLNLSPEQALEPLHAAPLPEEEEKQEDSQ